jgi:hypothetical protein
MVPVDLKTVRPFIMEDIVLCEHLENPEDSV